MTQRMVGALALARLVAAVGLAIGIYRLGREVEGLRPTTFHLSSARHAIPAA